MGGLEIAGEVYKYEFLSCVHPALVGQGCASGYQSSFMLPLQHLKAAHLCTNISNFLIPQGEQKNKTKRGFQKYSNEEKCHPTLPFHKSLYTIVVSRDPT